MVGVGGEGPRPSPFALHTQMPTIALGVAGSCSRWAFLRHYIFFGLRLSGLWELGPNILVHVQRTTVDGMISELTQLHSVTQQHASSPAVAQAAAIKNTHMHITVRSESESAFAVTVQHVSGLLHEV